MIPIEQEPPDMGPPERCCFCGKGTRFWTALPDRAPGEQVACCLVCAMQAEPWEVPSKEGWFNTPEKFIRREGKP